MKKSALFIIVFLVMAMLASLPDQARPVEHVRDKNGFFSHDLNTARINAASRRILHKYLMEDFRRDCFPQDEDPPEACRLKRPYYVDSSLPRNVVAEDMPPHVTEKIAFVPPGTSYVKVGYTIYLISWPRKIIYDSVTLWDGDQ